jgi:hypothetical protein
MLREQPPNPAETMMNPIAEDDPLNLQAHTSPLLTILMVVILLAGFTMLIVAIVLKLAA